MNKILFYILLPIATLLLAVAVVFVLKQVQPGFFASAVPPAPQTTALPTPQAPVDTPRTTPAVKPVPVDTARKKQETVIPPAWNDSLRLWEKRYAAQKSQIDMLERTLSSIHAAEDSAKAKERAQFVRLIDSMNPEGAAQILSSMKDEDVKKVLLGVKARQAGKILSAMEPKRVARMMN